MADENDFTCYAYADFTHEYSGQTEGYPSPREPEVILFPRNTTLVAPPKYRVGYIPVFNLETETWAIQPDFRGTIGYDKAGNPVLIAQAGDPTTFNPPLTRNSPTPELPQPPDPNSALRTSKVAFWRRATEEEAAHFLADLTDASPRLKSIFDAVMYLIPGSPEYPDLRAAIEARVGPERADELLAPSND